MPIGSALGRHVLRTAGRWLPGGTIEGVGIETLDSITPRLRVYRPDVRRTSGALLWIHGGGYLIGTASQDDRLCGETSRRLGVVVASVEYRLAPEHPFPAALDDCLAAWTWLQRAAVSLAVDPRRVVVGGQSAGGGLAASLVQRLHDLQDNAASAQWLFCPMLDDRTTARRELDRVRHRIWDNRLNRIAWRSYLGADPGASGVPTYAVPARRSELGGLPPTWIGVGDIELFHDEAGNYAERLRQAGVPVTLDVVPGAPHGFEAWARGTAIAQAYVARAQDWLSAILEPSGPVDPG